jgi:apolipoprotein N-acyltransferase
MQAYLLALATGTTFGLAWWIPGTVGCALLGWLAAFLLVALVRRYPLYRLAYLVGVTLYILGFYWLVGTIVDFGGFPFVGGLVVFGLFVGVSALQLVAFLFVYRNLPGVVDRLALGTATAWTVAEFITFRIFPWAWGHTQLGWGHLAQGAEIAGVTLISFVVLWVAEATYRLACERERRLSLVVPLGVLAAICWYGEVRISAFSHLPGGAQPVALVQANLAIREKGNIKFFDSNLQRYVDLTSSVATPGRLVVWPETVFNQFIPADIGSVRNDPRIPFWDGGVSLLFGALTFTSETEYHNSAVAVIPDGTIPRPYHKRILMPFGEYTPLGDVFPFIKALNATAGDFTPGREVTVFSFPRADGTGTYGVAPLICYEDIVPSLAREAVRRGAGVLVNMTNDAWFGDTPAPRQHHLIAAWRAIENRRYLLRSTNSGLTAVVDPLGRTIGELPTFADGVLESTIVPLDIVTPYTAWVGERPWWVLTLVTLIGVGMNRQRRPKGAF